MLGYSKGSKSNVIVILTGIFLIVSINAILDFNIYLIFLTYIVVILSIFNWDRQTAIYYNSIIIILLLIFNASDVFWFYFGFELLLIPVYLLVINHGHSFQKLVTSYSKFDNSSNNNQFNYY